MRAMTATAQTVTVILTAITLIIATLTSLRHRIKKTAEKLLARSGPVTVLREDLAQQRQDIRNINKTLHDIARQQQADVLMRQTFSRTFHEYQIRTGEQYLANGGNGVARIQYQVLSDDYNRRLTANDWAY